MGATEKTLIEVTTSRTVHGSGRPCKQKKIILFSNKHKALKCIEGLQGLKSEDVVVVIQQ